MTTYKHENGRWYTRFQIRGKRYHIAIPEATDKKSASQAEIKIKAELLSGRYELVENKRDYTFFDACQKFEEYAINNRKGYANNDKYTIKRLKNFYGNCLLKDFTPFVVEQYRSKLKKNGLKGASINREVGVIRRIFSLAVDNGWMASNPALGKFVKPLAVDNKKIRIITPEEEVNLLKACEEIAPYLKPILICALHTALRKSEILRMKWENIDLKNNLIAVLIQKNGKKSYLPISDTLKNELLKLYKTRTTEYVFVNPETGLPYVDIKKSYKSVLKKAKIENFTFHALRHTACTRLIELGVTLDVVKDLMRHSNISITIEVYNHINQQRKFDAIKALENYGKSITATAS